MSGEIGGCNSVVPLAVGAMYDIPIVDADLMGRAFPSIELTGLALCD